MIGYLIINNNIFRNVEYYQFYTKEGSKILTSLQNDPKFYTRDGPFDIQGGRDFSSRQVIFFSLFAQQVSFFKSKLQQFFYFFEK